MKKLLLILSFFSLTACAEAQPPQPVASAPQVVASAPQVVASAPQVVASAPQPVASAPKTKVVCKNPADPKSCRTIKIHKKLEPASVPAK